MSYKILKQLLDFRISASIAILFLFLIPFSEIVHLSPSSNKFSKLFLLFITISLVEVLLEEAIYLILVKTKIINIWKNLKK